MKKFSLRDKHILTAILIVCAGLMVLTFAFGKVSSSAQKAAAGVIVPMQNGINRIGSFFTRLSDGFQDAQELAEENRKLKEQIAQMEADAETAELQLMELERLEALVSLSEEYPNYEMAAAEVIAKDPGNWYNRFIINKGSDDGIEVDMNVLSGGGLFGIVTEVGPKWAAVRSIIDDESNISAMAVSSSETCTVTGSLANYENGVISFFGLRDNEDQIVAGERIVTSNISEKYLPGITIGYVNEISKDANNLTKSGNITPSASFDTLREVLVILELKATRDDEE